MTMQYHEMKEELEQFRESVQRFVKTEITPHYEQWERDEIVPRDVWRKLGQQGLLGVDLPEEYGGVGTNFAFSMVILEEFMRANCASIGGSMTVHSDVVAHYILNTGTEEQKQRYLPDMVTGECVGAVAMTEPGTGSDLQGIRTVARKDGDDYIINGSKTFITNGQHADVVVVVAKTNTEVSGAKGTTLFLVDSDSPGFSRGRNLEKIGMHASDTSELFFERYTRTFNIYSWRTGSRLWCVDGRTTTRATCAECWRCFRRRRGIGRDSCLRKRAQGFWVNHRYFPKYKIQTC